MKTPLESPNPPPVRPGLFTSGLLGFVCFFCIVFLVHAGLWAEYPKVRVESQHDLPLFSIDGEEPELLTLVCLDDPEGREERALKAVAQAASCGVHNFMFVCRFPWEPPFDENYEPVDRFARRIIETDTRARLVLNIWVGPSKPWLEEHADSIYTSYPDGLWGDWASPASEEWLRAACRGVQACVRHFRETGLDRRIIGFRLSYGRNGEWVFPPEGPLPDVFFDYSRASQAAFRRWVRSEYLGDVERLRYAWSVPALDFRAVSVPSPAERCVSTYRSYRGSLGKDQSNRDYEEFFSNRVSGALARLAEVVKEMTDRRSLVIASYGYLFELSTKEDRIQRSGHLAAERVFRDGNIDLLYSPLAHGRGHPTGTPLFYGPEDTLLNDGRPMLHEAQPWVSLSRSGVGPSLPSAPGAGGDLAATREVSRLQFFQALFHGAGIAIPTPGGSGWEDGCGPWEELTLQRELAGAFVNSTMRFTPEVAVVLDESSFLSLGPLAGLVKNGIYRLQEQLQTCGTSVGYYHMADLRSDHFPPSRLIIFPNALDISEEDEAAIANLKQGGRSLLWCLAPGIQSRDGFASEDSMSRLTGITLRVLFPEKPMSARTRLQIATDHPLLPVPRTEVSGCYTGLDVCVVADDPEMEVLGSYAETPGSLCSFAMKRHGGKGPRAWTSVFLGTPGIPSDWVSRLAREAGCRIYMSPKDLFSYRHGWMLVHTSREPGVRTVHIPEGFCGGSELLQEADLVVAGTEISWQARGATTYLLCLE